MRILVIEDERKIASFIKRGLREEGYTVDTAFDGEEGYRLTAENEYDLVILDVMLPKRDGISLCRQLRQDGMAVPVLMLTAKDSVQDKVKGLDAGADDYLTKPFAFEELQARIRALLRKGVRQVTRLQVDDLVLDVAAHKATRGSREIVLTMKEYSLLEYLVRNAGKVVTRTMIAEHVWDYDFDSMTNVIDVYVNYLRKKIESDSGQKLIQTVRGVGYILKEE
jgi:heavy metal response regulator